MSKASDPTQRTVAAAWATGFIGIAVQGDKPVQWKLGDAIPGAVTAAIAETGRSVPGELSAAPCDRDRGA